MPGRPRNNFGEVRGEARQLNPYSAEVKLESEQALDLIRRLADALKVSNQVIIEPHWGRRGGGLHKVRVRTP